MDLIEDKTLIQENYKQIGEKMSELHPEAFAFFTSVPLTFQTVHDGVNVEAFGNIGIN